MNLTVFSINQSHVHHMSVSFVISVNRIRILHVKGAFVVQFWVIWMMNKEFKVSLEGTGMLSMQEECERPEHSFPSGIGFRVFDSQQIFIVYSRTINTEMRIR